jgi:hypothetical protein
LCTAALPNSSAKEIAISAPNTGSSSMTLS